jgi:hypothetical protein
MAVEEIMGTTFGVPVKRPILIKGTDYQDQLASRRDQLPDPGALDPGRHVR